MLMVVIGDVNVLTQTIREGKMPTVPKNHWFGEVTRGRIDASC